jgi:glutamate-1-semialdehyde 2,1-aminomutase
MTPLREPANITIASALAEAEERYRRENPKSLRLYEEALRVMPGGNTRTSVHVDPFPLAIERGEGAHLFDADGHEYADFLSEFTAGLYGHSHPRIRAAILEALDRGLNFGARGALETAFAAALCARFPSLERLRFTNSGTEANLMALSAARAITGRAKILVFSGAYHGGVFYFRGGPNKINAPFEFLIGRYNDLESVEMLVAPHKDNLAAILVEPMLGSGGCIAGKRSFLEGLRRLASESGAILIFDEVMTSRLAPGGLQEALGILPDLTTLGKYLGGGMSFGAFGGRAELMDRFDPRRPDAFQHAGTFNNNVLTMSAGLAGLTEIYTPERARALNAFGERLRASLNERARQAGVAMQFTGLGSMFSVHMTARPVRSAEDAARGHQRLKDLFYFDLLARGVWFAKRGFFALSLALEERDGERLLAVVEDFAEARAPLFAEAEAI